MLVAIDLDDVLADTINAFIQFHNKKYGTTFVRNDFFSYYWEDIWGGTREDAIRKFFEFTKTPYFETLPPVPGSQDGVAFLKRKHDLIVVTSRQHELTTHTKKWIKKHFNNIFRDIYITNHPHFARSGKTKTKREVCDELGVQILIEDSIGYATECVTDDRKIFLLNTPWNQDDTSHPNIYRVNSWKELIKHSTW